MDWVSVRWNHHARGGGLGLGAVLEVSAPPRMYYILQKWERM